MSLWKLAKDWNLDSLVCIGSMDFKNASVKSLFDCPIGDFLTVSMDYLDVLDTFRGESEVY